MDDKNLNTNGFEPQNNQNEQNAAETNSNEQKPAEDTVGFSSQSSGWVFSNKNVSGETKEEPKKEGGFFHKEGSQKTAQSPNEDGWYRSGPNNGERQQQSAYDSKYSYQVNSNHQNPYENQQSAQQAKANESYKWNYEDYNKEKPKQSQAKNKKNKGLKVFTIIMCAILCAGVVSLAGYGTYALIAGQNGYQKNQQTSAEENKPSGNSAQLTLNDKPAGSSGAAVDLAEGELTITQRAQKVQPSAVGIVAYVQSSQSIFGGEQSQGSGIILSKNGYIVTNAHVVAGATSVKVVLNDDSEYNATIVGTDEKTDLAVLKVEADNLTPAEFGNSDQLEIGEQVITVGNPGGLELAGSVTVGYVSALNRPITTTTGNTINCIQTDAAINPGNSGGALVNTYGQVIGINSQKIAATEFEGIGFAISINEAQPIINDLIEHGYVTGRVKMGITMQILDQFTAQMNGYVPGVGVVSVEQNSPASKAGLVPGDIITEIDGESVVTQESLANILAKHKPGDVITLTVYRQSQRYGKAQELTVKMTLAEAGAPAQQTAPVQGGNN